MLFSWDNGTFNGGVFGNATIGENSTWKYGNFNGGRFQEEYGKMVYFLVVNLLVVQLFSALGGTSSGSIAPGADKFKDGFNQIIMDFGEMV
jgi:hypothetical protein